MIVENTEQRRRLRFSTPVRTQQTVILGNFFFFFETRVTRSPAAYTVPSISLRVRQYMLRAARERRDRATYKHPDSFRWPSGCVLSWYGVHTAYSNVIVSKTSAKSYTDEMRSNTLEDTILYIHTLRTSNAKKAYFFAVNKMLSSIRLLCSGLQKRNCIPPIRD